MLGVIKWERLYLILLSFEGNSERYTNYSSAGKVIDCNSVPVLLLPSVTIIPTLDYPLQEPSLSSRNTQPVDLASMDIVAISSVFGDVNVLDNSFLTLT